MLFAISIVGWSLPPRYCPRPYGWLERTGHCLSSDLAGLGARALGETATSSIRPEQASVNKSVNKRPYRPPQFPSPLLVRLLVAAGAPMLCLCLVAVLWKLLLVLYSLSEGEGLAKTLTYRLCPPVHRGLHQGPAPSAVTIAVAAYAAISVARARKPQQT